MDIVSMEERLGLPDDEARDPGPRIISLIRRINEDSGAVVTQEQRAAVGAIKRVLRQHSPVIEDGLWCHCTTDIEAPVQWTTGHVAYVLLSELGLVLS